jgi:hypothetical protein
LLALILTGRPKAVQFPLALFNLTADILEQLRILSSGNVDQERSKLLFEGWDAYSIPWKISPWLVSENLIKL